MKRKDTQTRTPEACDWGTKEVSVKETEDDNGGSPDAEEKGSLLGDDIIVMSGALLFELFCRFCP